MSHNDGSEIEQWWSCAYSTPPQDNHTMEPDEEVDETGWEGVYHENFPQEWAVNHLQGTGPHHCGNCAHHGCVGDVFVGYCANCAIYQYKGSRGRGFYTAPQETTATQYPSAFDTYLNGVVFDKSEPHDPMDMAEERDDPMETSYDPDDYYYRESTMMESHYEGGYADC
jgi:hypothetical protein